MADPETTPRDPEYRLVPMVSHGQELADLIRLTSEGFILISVGQHAYTLKRIESTTDA